MAGSCGPNCGYCGRCEREPWDWIVDETVHAIWCDWCEKYIDVGKEVLANHGGRFCSDECATLWADGERVGDIAQVKP